MNCYSRKKIFTALLALLLLFTMGGAALAEDNAYNTFKDILDRGEIDLASNTVTCGSIVYEYSSVQDYVDRWEAGEGEPENPKGVEYTIKNDTTYVWNDYNLRNAASSCYLQPRQYVTYSDEPITPLTEAVVTKYVLRNGGEYGGYFGIYPVYVVHTANLYKGRSDKGIIVFKEPVTIGYGKLYLDN